MLRFEIRHRIARLGEADDDLVANHLEMEISVDGHRALGPACRQYALGYGAWLDPALFAHLLPNHVGRPAFLLGKLFERVNVSAANALEEFDYQLTLLPL